MKKIFSNFYLIFQSPFKLLKRTRVDNFLGGLIVGALFSLLVNIFTLQIQEEISKQRILEAIENEVATNMLQASNVLTENNDTQQKNMGINNFHTFRKYTRDLWEQSTEPLQYIAQLDSQTQIKLSVYYTITIPRANLLQDKLNSISDKLTDNCFDEYDVEVIQDKLTECNKAYYNLLQLESDSTSKSLFNESYALLQQFHPTADRLNSRILRFLMGSQSMRILSGE